MGRAYLDPPPFRRALGPIAGRMFRARCSFRAGQYGRTRTERGVGRFQRPLGSRFGRLLERLGTEAPSSHEHRAYDYSPAMGRWQTDEFMSHTTDPRLGTTLGSYRLESLIGRGRASA